jgi:telomerase Cajal body protein 1
VYDFCWYPMMRPGDLASCCYVSTSRDHPIHLWDAFTGQVRRGICSCCFSSDDEIINLLGLCITKVFVGTTAALMCRDPSHPPLGRIYRPGARR